MNVPKYPKNDKSAMHEAFVRQEYRAAGFGVERMRRTDALNDIYQPEGSYRFGTDALVLADAGIECIRKYRYSSFADLGTGCGIVALSVLSAHTSVCGVGIERESVLACAARYNAEKYRLRDRFFVSECDVGAIGSAGPGATVPGVGVLKADMVLANPPWRVEGTGRMPSSPLRRAALFGKSDTMERFALAAMRILAANGRYLSIVGIRYADAQQKAILAAGFCIEDIFEWSAAPSKPPCFALFTACRDMTAQPKPKQ